MRTTYCGLVSEALMGQTVTLMGWAHRRRDHGGVIFIDLRDREGLVQIVCNPEQAEVFKAAEAVRNEFCLRVTGVVKDKVAAEWRADETAKRVQTAALSAIAESEFTVQGYREKVEARLSPGWFVDKAGAVKKRAEA